MLDTADWEKGTIFDWTDKGAALDMEMPWRTVQDQRQELVKAGYITCQQKPDGLNVIIHNYINPRSSTTENPVHPSNRKPRTLPIISDLKNTIVIPRTVLSELRNHFAEAAEVALPIWKNLNSRDKKKYGGWWNTPLKTFWLACDQDVERTKQVISLVCESVKGKWDIFAPSSIEKAFYKYLKKPLTTKEMIRKAGYE